VETRFFSVSPAGVSASLGPVYRGICNKMWLGHPDIRKKNQFSRKRWKSRLIVFFF